MTASTRPAERSSSRILLGLVALCVGKTVGGLIVLDPFFAGRAGAIAHDLAFEIGDSLDLAIRFRGDAHVGVVIGLSEGYGFQAIRRDRDRRNGDIDPLGGDRREQRLKAVIGDLRGHAGALGRLVDDVDLASSNSSH